MKLLLTVLLTAALALAAAEQRILYHGYKAYRISTAGEGDAIRHQISDLDYVSLSCHEVDEHFDIAVAPSDVEEFEALDLPSEVITDDLGADMTDLEVFGDYEGVDPSAKRTSAKIPPASWFNTYHAYEDHRRFFNDLSAAFPDNSKMFVAGKSYQGRDIYGIHFWGGKVKGMRPAVYFHATVHAREWIAAPVVEYIVWKLIGGYLAKDKTAMAIVDKYDFYVIPFVNPDGFVYSQTTDRLWRKNRQVRSGTSCIGTDNNRNWPYKWSVPGGASKDPCDETYKGKAPGDTPEIAALVNFTKKIPARPGMALFVDWHSYGQYLLQPYGFDCGAYPANIASQVAAANEVAGSIYNYSGSRYVSGPSCSTLYPTTGDSIDYMTGVALADFAWTVELRPSSNSAVGFVLPADKILSVAKEQWEGMKTLFAMMD